MRQSFILIFSILSAHLSAQDVWTDPTGAVTVYFHISPDDYNEHKHRTSNAYDVIETKEEVRANAIEVVKTALSKYPQHILEKDLSTIYIYDRFDKNDQLSGAYKGRHGFFFKIPYTKSGEIDVLDFERLLHHEFGHRLHIFNIKAFDKKAWEANNTMKYGAKYKSEFKILEFDPTLHERGFIYSYGLTNIWEDFTSFAENIFIYQPAFWEAIATHDRLRNKFEIIADYYQSLDPMYSREYFLKLNNIQLPELN